MLSARTIRAAAKQALAVNAKIIPRVVRFVYFKFQVLQITVPVYHGKKV